MNQSQTHDMQHGEHSRQSCAGCQWGPDLLGGRFINNTSDPALNN